MTTDLFPAPWRADGGDVLDARGALVCYGCLPEEAVRIALLRNAADVMIRRDGWVPYRCSERGWDVLDLATNMPIDGGSPNVGHADPFTALVEADRWYRENVEGVKP